MVVNTFYRFLFVHVPKAGGTSVAATLSRLDGNHTGWIAKTKHETLAEFREAIAARLTVQDREQGIDPNAYYCCACDIHGIAYRRSIDISGRNGRGVKSTASIHSSVSSRLPVCANPGSQGSIPCGSKSITSRRPLACSTSITSGITSISQRMFQVWGHGLVCPLRYRTSTVLRMRTSTIVVSTMRKWSTWFRRCLRTTFDILDTRSKSEPHPIASVAD